MTMRDQLVDLAVTDALKEQAQSLEELVHLHVRRGGAPPRALRRLVNATLKLTDAYRESCGLGSWKEVDQVSRRLASLRGGGPRT